MLEDEFIVDVAKRLFKRVPQTEKAKYLMKLLEGKSAQFNVTDGKPFFIVVKGGEIQVSEEALPESYWTFQANTDTYRFIFEGRIQISRAVGSGKLTFSRLIPHEFAGYALLGAIITMCQEEIKVVLAST